MSIIIFLFFCFFFYFMMKIRKKSHPSEIRRFNLIVYILTNTHSTIMSIPWSSFSLYHCFGRYDILALGIPLIISIHIVHLIFILTQHTPHHIKKINPHFLKSITIRQILLPNRSPTNYVPHSNICVCHLAPLPWETSFTTARKLLTKYSTRSFAFARQSPPFDHAIFN